MRIRILIGTTVVRIRILIGTTVVRIATDVQNSNKNMQDIKFVCSRVFAKQTDQDVVSPTVPHPSIQPNDLKAHRFSFETSLFASCRWKHLPRISVKNTTKASLLYLCLLTLTDSDVETTPDWITHAAVVAAR